MAKTVNGISSGNSTSSNFFVNSTKNRLAQIPGASALAAYGNKNLGQGSQAAYTSQVSVARANGAGPAIPPITAPFSFTQFATGKRILTQKIKKRLGK
jgi:hypothetical protein